MFLEEDKKTAEQSKHFSKYSLLVARRCIDRGEYQDSITHLRNAITSVHELQQLKNNKATEDKIKQLFKEIGDKQYQEEILENLGVEISE